MQILRFAFILQLASKKEYNHMDFSEYRDHPYGPPINKKALPLGMILLDQNQTIKGCKYYTMIDGSMID